MPTAVKKLSHQKKKFSQHLKNYCMIKNSHNKTKNYSNDEAEWKFRFEEESWGLFSNRIAFKVEQKDDFILLL